MTGRRIAVVTGAAGAIGAAITTTLVADGATVVATDLSSTPLVETWDAVEHVEARPLDITDEADVDARLAEVVSEHGRVDIVVNNAGITRDGALHKMSLEDFRAVLEVNLVGTFLMTRAAMRHMRGREGGGRIVNISSMSARLGNFGQVNYAASKAGVLGLTRVAAREGARAGVTVNAVLPGFIATPMTAVLSQDVISARMASIPLGRAGDPREVADVVRWLCSPGASYVTGTTVEVAGGRGL